LEHWTSATLLDGDGLYVDHLALDGSIDPTRWSYNQGSMVAANALLYRADGDPEHLGRARDVATASLTHFDKARLMGQPPIFNAIFTRGLFALHATRPDDSLLRPLLGYAEDLYREQIDRSSGRVTGGAQVPNVLLQAGVISVLGLAGWPASRFHLLV
jgi:predicted alpha-1,6-mannanase (GH76 family)